MCDKSHEREPVFEWSSGFDYDGRPLRQAHPLTLVARALQIVMYLEGTAQERGDSRGWTVIGITEALSDLVKHGGYEAAALLLQALEEQAPEDARRRWPLAGWHRDIPEAFQRAAE